MYFAAEIDVEKCKGCRLCVFACPEPNVIAVNSEQKKAAVDIKRCKGGGLCIEVCEFQAAAIVAIP